MKIFHAELAVQPAFYSFGYSTYAYLEESDDLAECYRQGFLPFVGVRDETKPILYMARGTRVIVQEFKETTYHHRVVRRVHDRCGEEVKVNVYKRDSFEITPAFIEFLLNYFRVRFGKESMPAERLTAILQSPLLTHIVAHTVRDVPVAYTLETHTADGMHVWYISYVPSLHGSHLGAYLFVDLMRRARAEGKSFVYMGVTCGLHMRFKTYFQPLEYWDGSSWVHDPKSARLKRLLATDATRSVAFTDAWRDSRHPYYMSPVRYENVRAEFRFLAAIFFGLPRISRLIIVFSFLLTLLIVGAQARILFGV